MRCVFFFQAEDGIRDVAVTGVQTCALPIWAIDGGFSAVNRLTIKVPVSMRVNSLCPRGMGGFTSPSGTQRSEEHTSELQSRLHLVCRLLLEKTKIVRSFHNSSAPDDRHCDA